MDRTTSSRHRPARVAHPVEGDQIADPAVGLVPDLAVDLAGEDELWGDDVRAELEIDRELARAASLPFAS